MTMTERFALEAAAIGAFESFIRQQDNEGRGKSIRDWTDLTAADRDSWRSKVRELVLETI